MRCCRGSDLRDAERVATVRADQRLRNAECHSGETGLRVTIRTPGSAVARAEMSRGSTVRTTIESLVAQAATTWASAIRSLPEPVSCKIAPTSLASRSSVGRTRIACLRGFA